MTGRPAFVAVMAAVLLVGCSAPGGQTSASSHPPYSSQASVSTTPSTAASPSASIKPSAVVASASKTTAPAAEPWTLSLTGLGPLAIGTPYSTLRKQGYATAATGDCPGSWTSKSLQDKGVYLYPSGAGDAAVLGEVSLTKAAYATVSGARVGSTMAQLKVLYGSQLTTETKNGNGGPFTVANVHIGAREIVFYFPYGSTLDDTDPVQAIIARNWSADMMGEC